MIEAYAAEGAEHGAGGAGSSRVALFSRATSARSSSFASTADFSSSPPLSWRWNEQRWFSYWKAEHEAARMLEAVRSLPEAYRETLVLRLVEGMTGPEIAARTGMTAASVRVNLHRGMKLLREKLGLEERP